MHGYSAKTHDKPEAQAKSPRWRFGLVERTLNQPKLKLSDLATRCQPSATTNKRILNGAEIKTGGIITMPIEVSTLATTKSTKRNGI